MQTDPTARHSPTGLFQRVCYLVRLARDGRVAAARGTRPPAPTLIGVVLDRPGQPEVTVDPSGAGVLLEGVRATLAYQPGSSGGWAGHQVTRRVCPVPTAPPGLTAQPLPGRPAEAERDFALAERLGSINATAAELGTISPLLARSLGTLRCRTPTNGRPDATTPSPSRLLIDHIRVFD